MGRSLLLLWCSLLAALLAGQAAPASAAPHPRIQLALSHGSGAPAGLCLSRAPDHLPRPPQALQLSQLAGLLAELPAAGARPCPLSTTLQAAALALPASPHQAGLVIDFGDGRVLSFCIELGSDGQASGEELLRASDLALRLEYTAGMGAAVCKIADVGSDFPAELLDAWLWLRRRQP